jgi:hypothetical protein
MMGTPANSPRAIGLILLDIPVAIALGSSFFPSYDARSQYFAGSFRTLLMPATDT